MIIKSYNDFQTIPNSETFKDKIPVFALPIYASWINFEKGYSTTWLLGEEQGIQLLIPFAVMEKGPFKKGMFLTEVLTISGNCPSDTEKEFLDGIINKFKKEKICDWVQQPPNWAIFKVHPTNSIYIDFGSYRISLYDKSEKELFQNIGERERRYIKKFSSENVIINKSSSFKNISDSVYLIRITAEKANLKYPNIKNLLLLTSKLQSFVQIYVSYFKDEPQSSVIFFQNNYCRYAIYAGKSDKIVNGINSYMYWQAIKDAKSLGIKYFDFVGAKINPIINSKDEGIQKFKERLGGSLFKGYLWRYPLFNWKYIIYRYFTNFTYFLRGEKYKGEIIDQELFRKNQ